MSNRLADSHSPYLLQHQDNPVQWYPWGEEAFAIAAQRQRPIFLSVGYAACHWCHVMERESFENEALAELLNEHFVSIKVDREERPDVDQIYMNAVQMMTGHGGWPMSVFLTPDRRPFFGGTYWPPSPRAGMPGFEQVLRAVADAWENRREEVLGHADQITDHLTQLAAGPGEAGEAVPEPSILDAACERLQRAFDPEWGGFGQAPKFPHASDLELLLRRYDATGNAELLRLVTVSLDAMAQGGIYDHLGGGFARYSVDRQWLVPHFEKMLYDNALLAGLYVRAALVTGSARYRQVARETLRYIVRDLTDPSGGFHSSEDADSEGEEGLYYVWTPEELHEVLGAERAERFAAIYDVTPRGNFEGRSILHLSEPIEATAERLGIEPAALREELEMDRAELLARRETRVRPGRDDKVLVAWNALAIESLALGGRALGEEEFVAAAERCARFLLDQLRDERGRLLHAFRRGTAHLPGFLDDYTNLIDALVTLYEATGREQWIAEATRLGEMVLAHFQNRDSGGFYYTADDHEALIVRTMDWHDSSMPSGNGSAAHALLRLARLTDHAEFEEAARRTLVAGAEVITRQTAAAGRLLAALDLWHAAPQQIVLSAPDEASLRPLTDGYFSRYRPSTLLGVVIGEAPENGPIAALLQGKEPVDGQPAAYVCQNFTCTAPVVGTAAVLEQLGR